MGKGGMSHGGAGEDKDGEEENMAAWLVGINTLKIQAFKLPPLGMTLFFAFLDQLNSSNLIGVIEEVLSTHIYINQIADDPIV
jgi:hypothetical protein